MSPGRGTGSRWYGFYGPRPFCAQKRENKGKNGIKQGMEERKWNKTLFWKCVI
ncbi:hypothetical protein RUMOBE_03026 [Blautia obeum ATCC 29174]|jgi:hypothetical protein|uniref:Uncharacterized protein n=1 Tax=Blautia obeum ATCC 29174 TaxID=411459 RepID=A5ZVJ0_9FIRM|nr:hypothetical protein RUMOBE_03026 [Blautia obeum ATCC 29174]